MTKGLYVAFTNCSDPARHEEYNRWYSHTHIPDLSGARGLLRANRFVNLQPSNGSGQYLVIYEFEGGDVPTLVEAMRRTGREAVAQGRFIDCLEGTGRYICREIDPAGYLPLDVVDYPTRPSSIPSDLSPEGQSIASTLQRAVLLVFTACTDPDRDEEFNRWYSHTHLPDLKSSMGLVRATRYRNVKPGDAPSTYLAIYEFEGDDLWRCREDFLRLAGDTFDRRHIDCFSSRGGRFFQ